MSTETQTAGTTQSADSTANTAATAQATAAAEAPATPKNVFEQGKAAAIARVEAMRAEKAQAAQAGQKTGEQSGGQSAQNAGEKAEGATAEGQTTATETQTGAETTQQTAAAEPSEEEKAAKELLAAAKENRALIEERKRLAKRDADLKEREAKLTTATVPERELSAKLAKARESNDPVELLRAAGYTDNDLGSFALNLIERMGSVGEEQREEKPQRPPTAEEVAAVVLKQAQEEQKERDKAAKAEKDARIDQERGAYFQKVGAEFKVNRSEYPILSALGKRQRPTDGAMAERYEEHFASTGERLSPQQLLAMIEKEYRDSGITVIVKQQPKPATTTATSKTISPKATSDAGPVVVDDDKNQPKTRDPYQVHEEGRNAAIAAINAKRAAKRAAR